MLLTQRFRFALPHRRCLAAAGCALRWQLKEQLRVRLHLAHRDLPSQIGELRLDDMLVVLL